MDNLECSSCSIFYDKSATMVGGKPSYQNGDRYVFWNSNRNKWMISTSTNTDSSFTTNEVKIEKKLSFKIQPCLFQLAYYCPEDLSSGWTQIVDGKFVPSAAGSMRCSDCVRFPTTPECGELKLCYVNNSFVATLQE